jgi:hypothetical protein
MKFPEEKTTRMKSEVSTALTLVREAGLFEKGFWIQTIIDMIIEHPFPKEIAGAILLLNHYLPKSLVNIQATDSLSPFLTQLFDALKNHAHPLILVAAYAILLPFETYPYQVIFSAEQVVPEHNKIYAYNQDGFVVYEFMSCEQTSMKVNSEIVFDEHLHGLKLKILNDAAKRGFIVYQSTQENHFVFYHLLETSLPLSYAIAMSHLMNLPLWKDETTLLLFSNVSYFMRFWIQDVHFLEPFMNLTRQLLTSELLGFLCIISKEFDYPSNGLNKILLLKQISNHLITQAPPPNKRLFSILCEDKKQTEDLFDEDSVYLNIFIQRAAFLRVLTRDVRLLMDFKTIDLTEFFEIPHLYNLKPEI